MVMKKMAHKQIKHNEHILAYYCNVSVGKQGKEGFTGDHAIELALYCYLL